MDTLKSLVMGNLDILVITESKLDINHFLPTSFTLMGSYLHFGLIELPKGEEFSYMLGTIFDVGYSQIILSSLILKVKYFRKSILGGINGCSSGVTTLTNTTYPYFLKELGYTLELYLPKYENILLLGDFNSVYTEPFLEVFCELYNVRNLIQEHTCFKNSLNHGSIDVI